MEATKTEQERRGNKKSTTLLETRARDTQVHFYFLCRPKADVDLRPSFRLRVCMWRSSLLTRSTVFVLLCSLLFLLFSFLFSPGVLCAPLYCVCVSFSVVHFILIFFFVSFIAHSCDQNEIFIHIPVFAYGSQLVHCGLLYTMSHSSSSCIVVARVSHFFFSPLSHWHRWCYFDTTNHNSGQGIFYTSFALIRILIENFWIHLCFVKKNLPWFLQTFHSKKKKKGIKIRMMKNGEHIVCVIHSLNAHGSSSVIETKWRILLSFR